MFCNHTKIPGNVKHFDLQGLHNMVSACFHLLCSSCTFNLVQTGLHIIDNTPPFAPLSVQIARLFCILVTKKSWSCFMAQLMSLSNLVFPKYFVNSLLPNVVSEHFGDNYIQGALVNYYHCSLHVCICISSFPNEIGSNDSFPGAMVSIKAKWLLRNFP